MEILRQIKKTENPRNKIWKPQMSRASHRWKRDKDPDRDTHKKCRHRGRDRSNIKRKIWMRQMERELWTFSSSLLSFLPSEATAERIKEQIWLLLSVFILICFYLSSVCPANDRVMWSLHCTKEATQTTSKRAELKHRGLNRNLLCQINEMIGMTEIDWTFTKQGVKKVE